MIFTLIWTIHSFHLIPSILNEYLLQISLFFHRNRLAAARNPPSSSLISHFTLCQNPAGLLEAATENSLKCAKLDKHF